MDKMTGPKARLDLALRLFGWEPHPTQRLWMLADNRVKVAACGRRWGKTEAAAVDVATYAIAVQGSVQMIVSPTYDQSRLIYDHIERMMTNQITTNREAKITKTPYPKILIGSSMIMARTADEDGRNLRGHSADRVIVDEAAYVRDAVVEEVISPMLADKNGQLVMISTPFGKNHFYRAFMQGAELQTVLPESTKQTGSREAECARDAGENRHPAHNNRCYCSFRFPSWENPHISREYIEFQRKVLTPRQFAVEYEAEFLDDQASVFPWDTIQSAVALGKQPYVSDEPWLVAGIDWARYSDYTAVVVIDAGAQPNRVVAMDRFHKLSWEAQLDRVAAFLDKHRASEVLTDQTSMGDPLLERLRNKIWERSTGTAVDGLVFTNTSKREIIDSLVIKLANQELAIPDDEQLIRELQYFEYELTTAGNIRMNARSGYTDDLVSALALAVWKGRRHFGSVRFLTSGRKRQGVRG